MQIDIDKITFSESLNYLKKIGKYCKGYFFVHSVACNNQTRNWFLQQRHTNKSHYKIIFSSSKGTFLQLEKEFYFSHEMNLPQFSNPKNLREILSLATLSAIYFEFRDLESINLEEPFVYNGKKYIIDNYSNNFKFDKDCTLITIPARLNSVSDFTILLKIPTLFYIRNCNYTANAMYESFIGKHKAKPRPEFTPKVNLYKEKPVSSNEFRIIDFTIDNIPEELIGEGMINPKGLKPSDLHKDLRFYPETGSSEGRMGSFKLSFDKAQIELGKISKKYLFGVYPKEEIK